MSIDFPGDLGRASARTWAELDDLIGAGDTNGDLGQLLDLVRDLFAADAAVIFTLRGNNSVLEPLVSSGIEYGAAGPVRILVGHGYPGIVAQHDQPTSLQTTGSEHLLDPVMLQRGISSLLGAPLVVGDVVAGIVVLGWSVPRDFTVTDEQLLTATAEHVALAFRHRAADEEHTAALVLQRSLLPTRPKGVVGLTMAARYVPAEGDLGGDWYDVFALPDGRIGFVMGDVVGHGLHSAVIMGRLRSALRAYALDSADPAEVLTRLDRKITHFEQGALATVIYGVSTFPFETVTLSSAGHWPPVLALANEAGAELPVPHDLLLGMDPATARRSITVDLPPGATICLYTDGLIERRPTWRRSENVAADPFETQLDALRSAFAAELPLEALASEILVRSVGEDAADDDIALLLIQRDP